jgi:hypothetical protein
MSRGDAWDGGHLRKLEAEYLAANPNISRHCPDCDPRAYRDFGRPDPPCATCNGAEIIAPRGKPAIDG